MSLEDVGPSPLVDVLAFLSIQDICSAAQTCRLFREASKVDRVWRRKAQEIYPSSTLSVSYRVEGSGYSSYLDLLRDDNAANSSLYLPLEHASCDYKYNSQGSHYEARVTALQLHRDKDRLLVCFDAIGEDDLRSPLSSSMALCVHRPHMNRFRLRMEMESIRRRREALEAMRSAPGNHMHGGVFSNYEGRRLHDCKVRQAIQSCIIMENDIYTRLIDAPALDFKDLLMPLRPLCQTLVVDVAGHRKGILEFEGTKFMEEALARASNSHFMREEIKKHGIDLVFCYANRLPVMPEVSRTGSTGLGG